ncbi:capreomycidine synthase [Exilibacterium tricleocarpae]|uniref:Capreomycidine synthase n=1 Tax=Exilibacterium tricleocarpae TaxID=2591008 RepID=A0A545U8M5_9GAMM|nr:capreomycidine synthase [Exilibacterium tricleocarpae]TQV85753.1 capreomycidine synthase [Exilibacterium tricleocarpae]
MEYETRGRLASYEPALLENWYRYNYFNNEIDISGSGVEEYTFGEVKEIAGFSFRELDPLQIRDCETVGGFVIRKQLADLFGTGSSERVMVTNGSNEALQLVVRSILAAGDEVVTQAPCYHCHDKIALSMGCTVTKWQFSSPESFDLDLHDLRRLVTKKTKAVILNFPHNPTGVSITQQMLDDIVDIVRENAAFLIWDAAFQGLTYDTQPLRDPVNDYDKVVSVGTFSKVYGAPGLRFGWIIAAPEILAGCVRQKDYGNLFVAPIIEFVAEKMLAKIDDFSQPRLLQAGDNREIVDTWIRKNKRLDWRLPDGGVCGLMTLPPGIDDTDFCKSLLAEYGVLLVPGSCFDRPGCVRLGFGGNTAELKEGLCRLGRFIR